ncbi:MAG: hypothetical protein Q4A27_02890 [bacterium]|nr:hypothetical protein [bacterium]
MKMNEYITRANLDEVAHSSGYAKAQSGRRFGAASSRSFSDRLAAENRNSKVRGYRYSKIAQQRIRHSEVSRLANSALDEIRQRREISAKIEAPDNPLKRENLHQPKKYEADFANISQSGMAGFSSAPSPSPAAAKPNFAPPIRPKF